MRQELQEIMQNHFGVFRTGEFMREGIAKLATLRGRVRKWFWLIGARPLIPRG